MIFSIVFFCAPITVETQKVMTYENSKSLDFYKPVAEPTEERSDEGGH
jgi:hypothetical protein